MRGPSTGLATVERQSERRQGELRGARSSGPRALARKRRGATESVQYIESALATLYAMRFNQDHVPALPGCSRGPWQALDGADPRMCSSRARSASCELAGRLEPDQRAHALGAPQGARIARNRHQRRVFPDAPIRVQYELTDKGRALSGVIDAIVHWAEVWVEPMFVQTSRSPSLPQNT